MGALRSVSPSHFQVTEERRTGAPGPLHRGRSAAGPRVTSMYSWSRCRQPGDPQNGSARARQPLLPDVVHSARLHVPLRHRMRLVKGRPFPSHRFHFSTKHPHMNPPPAQARSRPAAGGPQCLLCRTRRVHSHAEHASRWQVLGAQPGTGSVASGPGRHFRNGG